MAFSRNPTEYLERHGLVNASWPPRPRLDVTSLKVNVLALGKPYPKQAVLEDYESPADRGVSKPWPDQVGEYGRDV